MTAPPRWTDGIIFELIHYYQENPVLWCTKNVNYRNKKIKDQLYQTLSQKIDISVEEIKKKFCNLRTQFSKEQAKVVASCSSATTPNDVYVPGWNFYKVLTFLRDGPEYKECPSNVEVVYNSIPELTLEVDDARETENQDSESNSSVHDRPSDYYNPYSTPLPSLRKKRRRNEEADTTFNGRSFRGPESPSEIRKQMNSNEAFGVFVAKELDTIEDSYLVDETKFRIHEMLYKAKRKSY
ncbi:hypothetical protein JTE90_028031 [Oedothorax gibbosus]|uniref:MADF domain-containing protein n=1 Tax=Oedothorax gibbosus TaxID=931172 RepID=A0AAV6TVQ8_9ARAC|nr:hypothetical protein JTE90_028031 [Oedothorax gibbosus]